MLADGAIRPFIGRRVTMEEAGAALDAHEDRRSLGSHRRGDRFVDRRQLHLARLGTAEQAPARPEQARRSGCPDWVSRLPSLTPSSIVASAAKSAGSDDLGSDSYREPLEVFLAACEREAELTTFGRLLISKMLSSVLANRIALHRWSL